MRGDSKHAVMRFVIPVTLENIVLVLTGIIISTFLGHISPSALAATSSANLIINLYIALFSVLITGSAVLIARLIGAREVREASRTVEQSILLTSVLSIFFMLVSVLFANHLIRAAIPRADTQLYTESVRYFRIISLSIPFAMLRYVLMSVLRASGNSRGPLITAFAVNGSQILFAALFIKLFKLKMLGAALAYVSCQTVGFAMTLLLVFHSHGSFHVNIRNLARPHGPTIRRILRIGLPTSLEQTCVQIGYIVANALVVGLGTSQATIYNIANSINSFPGIPHAIAAAVSTTFVGQSLGAGKPQEAKRFGLRVLTFCAPIVLVLYVLFALLSPALAPLYTDDADVMRGVVKASWVLVGISLPSIGVNTLDPSLRVGGDAKFVMIQTILGVWIVRLPLTYLLGYALGMGITGVYLANIISLSFRSVLGFIRYRGGKWLYRRV
ncbi:MAG: MATE family efflux transporter [Christensenellales bacterium]|jgi:putative MATE family efflux protein